MKKLLITYSIVIFLFPFGYLFSQTPISVEYIKANINGYNYMKLILYENYSAYYLSDLSGFEEHTGQFKKILQQARKDHNYLFKLYDKKVIRCLSSRHLNNKWVVIEDSLELMKWKIQKSEEIKILGKRCFKATTTFRGRTYTAFYAPEIPVSDGPFKFSGLPGLILKIKSHDGDVDLTANKIVFGETEKIDVPEKFKRNLMPYWEFVRRKRIENKKIDQEFLATLPPEFRKGMGDIKISIKTSEEEQVF